MHWLWLAVFLGYYAAFTAWGLTAQKRVTAGIADGRIRRISLYAKLFLWQGVPALALLGLAAFGQVSFGALGLGWFRPGSTWLVVLCAVLAGLYLCFLALSLVGLRRNAREGTNNNQKIPAHMRALYPVTTGERQAWACLAFVVGFSEELLFRGFLFYVLGALFPALPPLIIALTGALLFAAGHLYQGWAQAAKPLLFGLLFGIFYLAFGTILPCILLHALQDLLVTFAVNEPAPPSPAKSINRN